MNCSRICDQPLALAGALPEPIAKSMQRAFDLVDGISLVMLTKVSIHSAQRW
jgi:hypothetical protein